MKTLRILNLGCGVNSTVLYLMGVTGELEMDYAIFADTQEEPQAVYEHLRWMQSLDGPPLLIGTAGKLGDHLMNGTNSTGGRFASIPCFTLRPDGTAGKTRRQCTKEYKVDVVERIIRREIVGLKPRQRFPVKTIRTVQYFGFTLEEQGRALRTNTRFADHRWSTPAYPLIDKDMTRGDCHKWMAEFGVPHEVPRSACTFCPYKSNHEWRWLRDNAPDDWQRACEIDEALRIPGNVCNRNLDQDLFVHRSCKPLREADIKEKPMPLFDGFREECEGGCGV